MMHHHPIASIVSLRILIDWNHALNPRHWHRHSLHFIFLPVESISTVSSPPDYNHHDATHKTQHQHRHDQHTKFWKTSKVNKQQNDTKCWTLNHVDISKWKNLRDFEWVHVAVVAMFKVQGFSAHSGTLTLYHIQKLQKFNELIPIKLIFIGISY